MVKVSYKPILIAGLIMVVIGLIGVSVTAPGVIQEAVPDTAFNIQSPPNEVELQNPMAEAEAVSIMLIIVGWIVSLFGWFGEHGACKTRRLKRIITIMTIITDTIPAIATRTTPRI